MRSSKTKAILLFMLTLTFGVLLFGGYLMHKEKPPIPKTVASADGRALYGTWAACGATGRTWRLIGRRTICTAWDCSWPRVI